ncbi:MULTISPECIES: hypothetical protein [Micrococcaceae]|jgi:hypothetical protein|uniref:Chitinase n=1 Tax=Paenarthrobacter aromaticivorans TaxID=2849150 RepID=A0ABS6I959_9MICC|nr:MULTISPECIES: hypothetical protein [Micrococcaceae]MBU8868243.1 hypothetical protein [Paenarthrobacter sp. MMS21-TAE1-1]BCW07772.1 hypothetical protein NtRootA1_39100 [Arthrobacter sp. NtRootA1]BCW46722.1 hypothetical protein StoSoilB5_39060 [Arthrobacter sp. StoSoilB5]
MKKFAATLLMAAVLAVTGLAAPANAEPSQDSNSTAIGWWPNSTTTKTETTTIGWWPN